ncbi:tetratricopeptide repeat protein [Lentisphaerota bacterium WC36G]|nr:tetratricopeptide repeat protein [Lentisphaerae bacterium WC36]
MIKKLEAIGVVILIAIGLSWSGFEIWIRNYADGNYLYKKGEENFSKNKCSRANFFFKLAMRAGSKKAAKRLIDIYKYKQNTKEVIYYYRWLLKNSSYDKNVLRGDLATIYACSDNTEKAHKLYSKINPNSPYTFFRIGKSYFAEKDLPQVIKYYKKAAINEHLFGIISLLEYYKLLNDEEKLQQFINEYANSKSYIVKENLAWAIFQKDLDKAVKIFEKTVEKTKNYDLLAYLYLSQKKYGLAIKYFNKKSHFMPKELAICYEKTGDLELAYKTASNIQTYSDIVYFLNLAIKLKKIKDAENNLLKKVSENKNQINYLVGLYIFYKSTKNTEAEKKTWYKITSQFSEDYALSQLANFYKFNKEEDKALEIYKKISVSNPKYYADVAALYQLSQKDYDTALEYYHKLLKEYENKLTKHDEYTRLLNTIANVYYKNGKYQKALEYAKKAKNNYFLNAWFIQKINIKINQNNRKNRND